MSTIMSSRRTHIYALPKTNWLAATVALVGGLIMVILGIRYELIWIAAIGFISSMSSLLYLNSMLWGYLYETKKISPPTHPGVEGI